MTSEPVPPAPAVGELLGPFLDRLRGRNITPAISDEPDFIDAADRANWNRRRALRWYEESAPDRFLNAGTDIPGVVNWIRTLAAGDDPGSLMLQGPVGCGKTHAAYAALRALAVSGATPIAWYGTTAAELFRRLRPGGDADPAAVMKTACAAELLLLDDLGATRRSAFVEEVLLDVIDARYTSMLPTIVTTNLGTDQLGDAIGYRSTSRLVEMCQWITFPDGDRRWTR